MRMTLAHYEYIHAMHRADFEREQFKRMAAMGRVSDYGSFRAIARTRGADAYRDGQRKAAREQLPSRAYVSHDAEARWILDRDTPGAFAAARAANRLRVLDAQATCDGCDGRGFCQCDRANQ